MADLAASAVTVLETWTEGGLHGKRHVGKRVNLNLTGQGGTTNRILATTLGFKRLIEANACVDPTAGDVYIASPSADGSMLILNDPSNAANAGMDVTDLVTINVKGIA